MKKIVTVMAISFSALLASGITAAAPQFDNPGRGYEQSRQHGQGKKHREYRESKEVYEKRRQREERGYQRDRKSVV